MWWAGSWLRPVTVVMCRFDKDRVMLRLLLLFGALASPAAAQDMLTRAQVEQVFSQYAICHDTHGDAGCETVDVYRALPGDEVEVTYVIQRRFDLTLVQERMFWQGDRLCLSADGSRIDAMYRLEFADNGTAQFAFDLSGAEPFPEDYVREQAEFLSSGRNAGICLSVMAQIAADGSASGVQFIWSASQTAARTNRLVPLTLGGVEVRATPRP